jgi:hypothetical protein
MKSAAWWNKLIQAIIEQGYPLWIVLLSQFTLFGLISYRLINATGVTEKEKKNFSYAELALSFVASAVFIGLFYLFCAFFIIEFPLVLTKGIFYKALFSFILIFIITPLGLTTFRVGLQDKLTEQQKDILSGLTLPSIVVFGWIGLQYAIGQRWWRRRHEA